MNIMNKSHFCVERTRGAIAVAIRMRCQMKQRKMLFIIIITLHIFFARRLILQPDFVFAFKLFPSHAISWEPAWERGFSPMANFSFFRSNEKILYTHKWIFRNFENQTKIESSFFYGFNFFFVCAEKQEITEMFQRWFLWTASFIPLFFVCSIDKQANSWTGTFGFSHEMVILQPATNNKGKGTWNDVRLIEMDGYACSYNIKMIVHIWKEQI